MTLADLEETLWDVRKYFGDDKVIEAFKNLKGVTDLPIAKLLGQLDTVLDYILTPLAEIKAQFKYVQDAETILASLDTLVSVANDMTVDESKKEALKEVINVLEQMKKVPKSAEDIQRMMYIIDAPDTTPDTFKDPDGKPLKGDGIRQRLHKVLGP